MTATLDGQVLRGLGSSDLDRVLRTLALAHHEGLDVRSALDASLMVLDGTAPGEAVVLAGQDAHDLRVKAAARQGTELVEQVRALRTRFDVSTGEGPAEPVLGDLIEAEYRDSQADYDNGPGHQDYDEDDDQDTEADA